jgi:MFS family permease
MAVADATGGVSAFPGARGSRQALVWVALAELLALSLWFSASAVAPALTVEWSLGTGEVAGLTGWVQIGFVAGALAIAFTNLADVIPSRRLFAATAVLGSFANLGLLIVDEGAVPLAMILRFVTGVALAGVYPSGLKIMAGWFERGRGMALGVLVGALTVGSASPHLVRGLGLEWRGVVVAVSAAAVVAAVIVTRLVGDGPYSTPTSPFDLSQVARILRNRRFRLATIGYLGHMWELYALWTWAAVFLAASQTRAASSYGSVSTLTFFVIAAGGVGSWLAGLISDRHGREVAAGIALAVSGSVALASPLFFGAPGLVVIPLMLLWGTAVVADSAQFSVIVTEVTRGEVRGTALTLQTALGFLLTLVTIRLTPGIADAIGWRWSLLWLGLGPVVGLWAMAALRRPQWRDVPDGLPVR